MDRDVVISLFGPAIRTELWSGLYESLRSNVVPFEIIFVGNQVPKFALPDNFHFIYSEVKPAQCAEIGSRYATGDLIMNIGDDLVFSEHALDNLYEEFNRLNNDKIILSSRYMRFGHLYSEDIHHYWVGDTNGPKMPVSGLMKRSWWRKLGGIDRRFIASCGDMDIALRMYEIGGEVILCQNTIIEELRDKNNGINLYEDVGIPLDRAWLDWLWVRKNKPPEHILESLVHEVTLLHEVTLYAEENKEGNMLSRNRSLPVLPFEDKHILTVSQGPKGKWK